MLTCLYVFLKSEIQRTQICRQQAIPVEKEIVSMSSDAGEASCDDFCMANDKMQLVEMKFSEGFQFRPWKDKARGNEWVQEEVLNASVDTKDVVIWKLLFHAGSLGLTVYLQNLSNDAVTDIVIPRIRTLLGPTGKVRRLNTKEVGDSLNRDKSHKAVMQAKSAAVGGDLGRVQSFLETAMSWQGPIDVGSPSKKQRQMSAQLVDVYWTAQQVAKSGVRTGELKKEQQSDE